jgi:hypothetical protein
VPDALYVAARRVLLDALVALQPHLEGVVLVGAQAIYVHTGEGDLAVAPYTTDGDIALSPADLAAHPRSRRPCVLSASSKGISQAVGSARTRSRST